MWSLSQRRGEKRRRKKGIGKGCFSGQERRRNHTKQEKKRPSKEESESQTSHKRADSGAFIQTGDTNPVESEGASIPWLRDSQLNSEKVKEAQRKDPVIGHFIVIEEEGNKPDWNDGAAQGNELKSYLAQ